MIPIPRAALYLGGAAIAAALLAGCGEPTDVGDVAGWEVPAPAADLALVPGGAIQTAVLAGGCFWGVEAVFEHVRGVVGVVSGYSGGTAETATYEQVSTGTTDHAETVQIRYDPAQISYGTLLHVFFSVAHNATELDQQYPDVGRQYRSEVFYQTDAERDIARAYIAQLDASKVLSSPIATRVDRMIAFFPAEQHHQNYLAGHRNEVYIINYDMPKLAGLRKFFPDLYQDQPTG